MGLKKIATSIDWELLRKQKLGLLEVIGEIEEDLRFDTLTEEQNKKKIEYLTGILHFIDFIQDEIAATGLISEDIILGVS